jgi:hypothetical protein
MYASLHEATLNSMILHDPNKAWRTVEKRIVNLAYTKTTLLKSLDGIQRLALEIA